VTETGLSRLEIDADDDQRGAFARRGSRDVRAASSARAQAGYQTRRIHGP